MEITETGNKNITVLSDFDGTFCLQKALNEIYRRFANSSWQEIVNRWDRGEISTMKEMEQVFATITAGRTEMETFLQTISVDPGCRPLIDFCRQEKFHFAVVSDGLGWYIKYIMEFNQLPPVEVFASQIHFEKQGFRFSYPYYDSKTPMRSTSKPKIIRDFQRRGTRVIFIGDGRSDMEAAHSADLLFAKDWLASYCREQGIKFHPFENLNQVVDHLDWKGTS